MAVTGIAFTMYPVSDMARASAFYTDVLGFTKGALESPYWAEFDVAGSTFGIGTFEQTGTPGTARSLAVEVPDLTEFRKTLSSKGFESTEPFETQICFISEVRDPDGNQVWLHQAKSNH